jgi:UDP-N-acetylglucosamine acyltransferase
VGLRRRGFSNEQITVLQEIYRLLYQSGMNNSKAMQYIEANVADCPEKREVLSFIAGSQRGIIRGYLE